MKEKIVILLMAFVSFLLQSTLFRSLAVSDVGPNLLVVLTAAMGIMRGKKTGMYTGLCCGLFMDIFFGRVLGFYALIYIVLGYLNGSFHRMFYPEEIRLPLAAVCASDLLQNLFVYIFLFVFRAKFHFGSYLIHVILPEAVYTVVVGFLVYRLILLVDLKVLGNE